jgi:predicted membrane protein
MKRSGALWGTLLIFIGLAWILDSANLLRIDILGSVMTLWPAFIIAAGITFFLKRESYIQRLLLWILVFALIGGYGIYLGYNNTNVNEKNKKFIMKPEIQSASMKINISGADFDIDAGETDLADIRTNVNGIKFNCGEGSNTEIICSQKVQLKGYNKYQNFTTTLNKNIPWNIELNSGSVKGSLNFEKFPLKNCTINTGACDLDIIAGNMQKDTTIVINGAAINLNLNVPENTGLKISSSSAATRVNGNVNLLKDGAVYQSDNFTASDSKIYVDIASAACNISVNR